MEEEQEPLTGAKTTADSEKEGRLIVSAGEIRKKKRKILKKFINSK
jgi:hypothetical protein